MEIEEMRTSHAKYEVAEMNVIERLDIEMNQKDNNVSLIESHAMNEFDEYRSKVYSEMNAFQIELENSTRQVQMQSAELAYAAQEDEGATYRIEELTWLGREAWQLIKFDMFSRELNRWETAMNRGLQHSKQCKIGQNLT